MCLPHDEHAEGVSCFEWRAASAARGMSLAGCRGRCMHAGGLVCKYCHRGTDVPQVVPIDRAKTWEAMQPLGHDHQRSPSARAPHAAAQQPGSQGSQGSLLSYSGRPKARQSTGHMQAINEVLCDDCRRGRCRS